MSENEQKVNKPIDPILTTVDIRAVFKQWQYVIERQIKKDYQAGRLSRQTAILQRQAVEDAKRLLLHITDLGLTTDIVIGWLEIEMAEIRRLAELKESQTAAAAA